MSGSFTNPTTIDDNMTSNDYIIGKKNKSLFCDINNTSSSVHKVKNNKLSQTSNHSTVLAMTKGYYDYYQTVDISNDFFTTYDGQIVKDDNCVSYPNDNSDISSNYFGSILTTYSTGYQAIIDSKAFFQNEYTESTNEAHTITDQHKTNNVKCFKMHTSSIQKT